MGEESKVCGTEKMPGLGSPQVFVFCNSETGHSCIQIATDVGMSHVTYTCSSCLFTCYCAIPRSACISSSMSTRTLSSSHRHRLHSHSSKRLRNCAHDSTHRTDHTCHNGVSSTSHPQHHALATALGCQGRLQLPFQYLSLLCLRRHCVF